MSAQMRKFVRRRLWVENLLLASFFVTLGYLAVFVSVKAALNASGHVTSSSGCMARAQDNRFQQRKLLQTMTETDDSMTSSSDVTNTTSRPGNASSPAAAGLTTPNVTMVTSQETMTTPGRTDIWPDDIFEMRDLKDGAVALYVLGVIYMFVALAIVCDEYFVPALEVISETLAISDDVAGATFMAAGGSAPELFTSLFSVFSVNSDVGIGTIVGSAVFNIMFVIGMCAVVSVTTLQLTWWPLFRDVSFYSISLIVLIVFFENNQIVWWQALILLAIYFCYVLFMKFNAHVESWIKSKLNTGTNRVTSVRSTDNLIDALKAYENGLPRSNNNNNSKFRHGVLQLLIHTIDPLGEAKLHEKAVRLHAIASVKVCVEKEREQNGNVPAISNGVVVQNGGTGKNHRNFSQQTNITTVGSIADYPLPPADSVPMDETSSSQSNHGNQANGGPSNRHGVSPDSSSSSRNSSQPEGIDDSSEPLDLSWPDTCRKRCTFILVSPILLLLYFTLADVRRPERRKYFPWTFIGSILWIAAFAFLMNWWAAVIGKVAGIKEGVMGLTFLAAGTSIPDLITSVIVAKKGFGDMAVSSSVGSNIFDVTVGLPLPWLLYGLIYKKPYSVNSTGMVCSIVLLFGMLMLVIIMIAAFRWQMNRPMGISMLLAYLVFLAISLLLEYDVINCNFHF